MGDRVSLDVLAEVLDGDYGRKYVRVTVGEVTVSVYESEVRPGGVTVDIDVDSASTDALLLSVCVNDGEVYPT